MSNVQPTASANPHIPSGTHHEEHAFEEQEGHHNSSLIYWLIGLVLAVITVLEVFAAALWFSSTVMLLVLMGMAAVKAVLIIAVFMHLQGDAGVFKFVFIAPFAIAVSFMLGFLLLFSTHVGIAG